MRPVLSTFVRGLFVGLIASILAPSLAGAQSEPAPPDSSSSLLIWGYGGPALTTLGPGASGGVAVDFERHVFSLRGTSSDPAFGQETWEVAALYGRALPADPFYFWAGVGAAVVGGTKYPRLFGGGKGRPFEPMLGFPLHGQLSWVPTRVVALDLYALANVNTGHPFGALGLALRVGHLW